MQIINPDDMKKFLLVLVVVFFISCQNEDAVSDSSFSMQPVSADYTSFPEAVQTVSGDITVNTVWTNDRVWEINGVVRVKGGARLTIQPGTFIKAKPLSSGVASGVLVVTPTGQIDAQGTANAPIVFTSYNLLDHNANTTAVPGDFDGVVILGDARINIPNGTNLLEGLGDQPAVSDFYYGGNNDGHNGGILRYVRIEYAGRFLSIDSAVNGLTLGGVGSNTTIDHVQVSYALDDSFEFFGGKVNASHLVSFAPSDDNFDFNFGYTGSITKAIAIADRNSVHSLTGGSPDSNGIEIDNNYYGTNTAIITRPVISQLSIIGVSSAADANLYENGIHIRRYGQISLNAATITGYNYGIRWETPSLPSNSSWSLISVHGFVNQVLPAGTVLGFGNVTSVLNPAPAWGLTQPFYNNGSLNLTGATGAFRTEANWTDSWTRFINF